MQATKSRPKGFGAIKPSIPQKYATGGKVKKCEEGGEIEGPGGPTDDQVPIMASNGEFVIKASSVKILGEDVLEALNDLGDEPKNPKDDAKEDAKEGEMKCGGKVKKMASGGMVRKMAVGGLINDPEKTGLGPNTTEGMAAAGAVHQAQLASANALAANSARPVEAAPAPVQPTPQVASGPSYQSQLDSANALAANKTLGAVSVPSQPALAAAPAHGAPYQTQLDNANRIAATNVAPVSNQVGTEADRLGIYKKTLEQEKSLTPGIFDYFKQSAPTSAATLQSAQQATKDAYQNIYGRNDVTQSATPVVAPSNQTQSTSVAAPVVAPTPAAPVATSKNVVFGVSRIDQQGKSPLFTNLTGSEGDANNAALMGRGAISPQNQAAAQALSDRYGAEARNTIQSAANKKQYDEEVADAQRINAAGRKMNLLQTVASGNMDQKRAAMAELSSIERENARTSNAASDKYKVDSLAKSQAAQTAMQGKHYGDANEIAQSQLGMTRAESQMKLAQAKQKDQQGEYVTNVVTDSNGVQSVVATNKRTGQQAGAQQGAQTYDAWKAKLLAHPSNKGQPTPSEKQLQAEYAKQFPKG